jgi:hypothetical protein
VDSENFGHQGHNFHKKLLTLRKNHIRFSLTFLTGIYKCMKIIKQTNILKEEKQSGPKLTTPHLR